MIQILLTAEVDNKFYELILSKTEGFGIYYDSVKNCFDTGLVSANNHYLMVDYSSKPIFNNVFTKPKLNFMDTTEVVTLYHKYKNDINYYKMAEKYFDNQLDKLPNFLTKDDAYVFFQMIHQYWQLKSKNN